MQEALIYIKNISAETYGVVILVLVLMTGILFIYIYKMKKMIKKIESAPLSKIRSAKPGYIKLKGKLVSMNRNLVSPLTNTPCCFYQYQILREEKYKDNEGNTNTEWKTIKNEMSKDFFLLDDNTGICLISPYITQLMVEGEVTWNTDKLPECFFSHSEVSTLQPEIINNISTSGIYRLSELCLREGQVIHVVGNMTTFKNTERNIFTVDDDAQEAIEKMQKFQKSFPQIEKMQKFKKSFPQLEMLMEQSKISIDKLNQRWNDVCEMTKDSKSVFGVTNYINLMSSMKLENPKYYIISTKSFDEYKIPKVALFTLYFLISIIVIVLIARFASIISGLF